MGEPFRLIRCVVSGLLTNFEHDPQAALLALLTLGYCLPLEVVLQSRWVDFNLRERVWRLESGRRPLTGPILDLLAHYGSAAGDRGEYMFTASCGGQLSKAQALRRVSQLSGGWWTLATLRAWALKGCPDLANGDLRVEILREYAGRAESTAQVVGLERELEARLRASVEVWHYVLLMRRSVDELAG